MLGLQRNWSIHTRQNVNDSDVCRIIIEGVVGSGQNCRLQAFYCNQLQFKGDESFMKSLSPSLFTPPYDPGPPCYQGLADLELCIDHESLPYLNALLQQQLSLELVILYFHGKHLTNTHQLFSTLSLLFSRPQFRFLHLEMHNIDMIAC